MGKEASVMVQRSSFSHPKADVTGQLAKYPFVSGVELVLPCATHNAVDESAAAAEVVVRRAAAGLEPICGPYFTISGAPLVDFLSQTFLDMHVRAPGAELLLLSLSNPDDDASDVVAISPTSMLSMRLAKDSYHHLGLPGKQSKACPGMYFAEIDLKAKSFRPGRPLHDKVISSLNRHSTPLNYICTFTQNGRPRTPELPPSARVTVHPLSPGHKFVRSPVSLPSPSFLSDILHPHGQKQQQRQQQLAQGRERVEEERSTQLPEDPFGQAPGRGREAKAGDHHTDTHESMHVHRDDREGAKRGADVDDLHNRASVREADGTGGGGGRDDVRGRVGDARRQEDAEKLSALYEWLGALLCDVQLLPSGPSTGLRCCDGTTADCWSGDCGAANPAHPQQEQQAQQYLQRLSLQGALTPSQVMQAVSVARDLVEVGEEGGARAPGLEWCALHVWGLPAAPVDCTDRNRPMEFGSHAADLSLLFLPHGDYLCFRCA